MFHVEEATAAELVETRLKEEIQRGVQTIQYQVVTLMTTNGQAPFVTVFMYLSEAKNEQEQEGSGHDHRRSAAPEIRRASRTKKACG